VQQGHRLAVPDDAPDGQRVEQQVLHLQVVAGFSPLLAGAALLPLTVLMLLSPAAARSPPGSGHASHCPSARCSRPPGSC
jgi:hypothetical protein